MKVKVTVRMYRVFESTDKSDKPLTSRHQQRKYHWHVDIRAGRHPLKWRRRSFGAETLREAVEQTEVFLATVDDLEMQVHWAYNNLHPWRKEV